MRLVGFNGREIREGTCNRGIAAKPTDDQDSEDTSTKIRGPICTDSIGTYIKAIAACALERFFNGVISILAVNSFFPKSVHALLDVSEIQSTENCIGCGRVTKEKAPELRNRKGRIRKVLETVFGFKLWAVWDSNSKLPLAIRFTTIEVADIIMAKEVVSQAINNLGEQATIASLAFDRGFLDGRFLWWLNNREITFYVPAKTNMTVYEDALALVEAGVHQSGQRRCTVGYGKNKRIVTDN